jgi:hypothetical protein
MPTLHNNLCHVLYLLPNWVSIFSMQLGYGGVPVSRRVQPIHVTGALTLFLQGDLIKIDVHGENLARVQHSPPNFGAVFFAKASQCDVSKYS